jgi:hypothetical protein
LETLSKNEEFHRQHLLQYFIHLDSLLSIIHGMYDLLNKPVVPLMVISKLRFNSESNHEYLLIHLHFDWIVNYKPMSLYLYSLFISLLMYSRIWLFYLQFLLQMLIIHVNAVTKPKLLQQLCVYLIFMRGLFF